MATETTLTSEEREVLDELATDLLNNRYPTCVNFLYDNGYLANDDDYQERERYLSDAYGINLSECPITQDGHGVLGHGSVCSGDHDQG